jgi:predicted negative regulator of RcsB-dependent stress response
MANTFDLEEQEQLDQLKHFWKRHGNWITWLLIAVLASFSAWNAWQYWQNKQSIEAAALYDELARAVATKQADRIQLSYTDLQSKYPRTTFAQQGALLAGRGHVEAGQLDKAKAALEWVASAGEVSLQSVARLRLAALAMEQQQWEAASKWLADGIQPEFAGLAADRQGDIHTAQGQADKARDAYLKAYKLFSAEDEYRRLIVVKLNALGVDPESKSKS